MRTYKIYILLFASLSLVCLTDCKRDNPPVLQNNPRLLVVDGFLTNAPDSTYITLTHSRNISDSTPSSVESNATLMVEAENATTVPMTDTRPGVYGGLFSMDSTQKNLLYIRTSILDHV